MATQTEIEALFVAWGPMVLRRALAILGNQADAEEATQDVFVRAIRALDSFEGRSEVSSWLYRITTNLCLNRIRNQQRRAQLRTQYPQKADSATAPVEQVVARQLLRKVPNQDWARTAVYVYMDGMTHAETAEVMGVSVRTIGNHLAKLKDWASTQEDAGAKLLIQRSAQGVAR